jgi:hypothetical protein
VGAVGVRELVREEADWVALDHHVRKVGDDQRCVAVSISDEVDERHPRRGESLRGAWRQQGAHALDGPAQITLALPARTERVELRSASRE